MVFPHPFKGQTVFSLQGDTCTGMWPPVSVISCVLFTCPQTCRTSWCVLAFLWVSSTHLPAGQGLCPHFLICSDFLLSLNPFLITQYKTVTDPHITYFSFNFSMVITTISQTMYVGLLLPLSLKHNLHEGWEFIDFIHCSIHGN